MSKHSLIDASVPTHEEMERLIRVARDARNEAFAEFIESLKRHLSSTGEGDTAAPRRRPGVPVCEAC